MMKYLVLLMVVGQLTQAQRSFYAGQQAYYPKVLARYTSTTTSKPESLDNRLGEGAVSSPSVGPSQEPLDPQEEYDRFIKRISSWPVDKQPFWFRNRQAINDMLNRGVDGGDGNSQQSSGATFNNNNPRSPFAGRG